MKPAPFEYLAPRDVPEALRLLAEHGPEAKVLAGGQSLVPLMNFRLARPSHLIDVSGLDDLAGIRASDGHVTIGAATLQREARQHAEIKQRLPILAEAIAHIGHPAIQNRGTVGGSIAHADPAAELPVAALALDAELRLQRAGGERVVQAEDFSLGYLTTVLDPDELLTSLSFAVPAPGAGWCFTEVARRQGDFALVAVATLFALDKEGRVAWARIALGGVGPTALRARLAEQLLLGEAPGEDLFRAAAAATVEAVDPEEDLHASADYRRHLAGVLVRRALTTTLERAGRHGGT